MKKFLSILLVSCQFQPLLVVPEKSSSIQLSVRGSDGMLAHKLEREILFYGHNIVPQDCFLEIEVQEFELNPLLYSSYAEVDRWHAKMSICLSVLDANKKLIHKTNLVSENSFQHEDYLHMVQSSDAAKDKIIQNIAQKIIIEVGYGLKKKTV